jgi:ABC-type multidrug transport system permease subunit
VTALAIGADRTVLELKMYFREKESVFFSFLFPILMLTLFSIIFGDQITGGPESGGVSAARFFLPGMVSARVALPTDAARWGTFAAVFFLGVAGGTVLGIAYSSLATSARSFAAVVIGPMLVLQFISGVYVGFADLPEWLKQVASVFPLKWVAQGMRSVFLPDSWATQEMARSWEHERTLLVLAIWFAVGLVLCARTFRWHKRGSV